MGSLQGRLSFSLAFLGVIVWSSWQLLARCWGLLDAQAPPKYVQNAKLWADSANTLNKDIMFWEGFKGWRHLRWLLETLDADLGADEVTLETLRGSWMLCWRSRGALVAQGGVARLVGWTAQG